MELTKQAERNLRKQAWMAHGYGIAKLFIETGGSIASVLDNVSDNGANEYDAFVDIIQEIEGIFHHANIASFTEKFLIFMLANQELKGSARQTHL